MNKLENRRFSTAEFEKFRQAFRRAQTDDVSGEIQQRTAKSLKKSNLSVIMTSLGIIKESKTHISSLALLKQRLEQDGDSVEVIQA